MADAFVELTDRDDPLFESFWLPLYHRAFPDDERLPDDEHRLAALNQNEHVMVGYDGGLPVSMARYDVVDGAHGNYGYLVYMAVAEDAVSAGHGQQMLGEIIKRLAADPAGARLLVLEVQRPDLDRSTEPHQSALRRISFYERQGARILGGVDYVQRVPGQPAVPMLIMARPLVDDVTRTEILTAAQDLFGEDLQVRPAGQDATD